MDILRAYPFWHYGLAIKELSRIIKNFLSFVLHFFSIPLLFKTLFHPWRRMKEYYEGGFDMGSLASAFIVNCIMRVVGFITRLSLIVCGLVSFLVVLFLGLISFIVWIFLPLIVVGCIGAGIILILNFPFI